MTKVIFQDLSPQVFSFLVEDKKAVNYLVRYFEELATPGKKRLD
jgi:hypothetical protein